ncbi:YT521-B-like domain-containing protein [Dissophora ornata]|nr:YT521-B-like domain-containing protein [Dissophora ornata]
MPSSSFIQTTQSIFILSKSNCAFVNYSSHEAVDRAVRRFHDREFKNTRLVCRPRKEPGADPYSNKMTPTGRYQSQHHGQQHHGQSPYMPDAIGYYGSDHSLMAQRMEGNDLSEAQARIERMRLEGSPVLDNSSSSGGEGSALGGQVQLQQLQQQQKRKDNNGGVKKSRSSSSLDHAESRYFILKSLNEEDLKLSVQYGVWATQDHLVPALNDAFANTKNVYLVFSANKSGEFFGYARMMAQIPVENETAFAAGKENEIWQPAMDIPLSPEMRAAMLEEIDQAAREGKKTTNEEAGVIARNSTTTKSWGIRFPIRWIHVHKVPFSKTTHMLNPLYENREVKVSKDGTEIDPVVGEQLVSLFKKSNRNRRGRSSVSGPGSRSNSGGSRRSSVAGESSSSLAPPQSHRSASSRRSSILSTRSTGSGGGGDRRSSTDPSRTHGPSYKTMHSPMHVPNRGQFGEGNQLHGGASGYRGPSRHGHYGSHSSHGSNTSQGPYTADQYPDQQRAGWGSKPNFRGGGPGGYGPASAGGSTMQGGYYQQDIPSGHRKGSGGPGGAGGKYNASYHSSPQHGGYEHPPFHSSHTPRRHPGPQHQHYHNSYRSNITSSGVDSSLTGNAGYKHTQGGTSPGTGPLHDQGYAGGGGPRTGHPTGGHIPPNQLGGQPVPPHPNVYAGQGPPGGYPAPFPPPGYPMMPPYMGFPYVPGPNPFMHGVMAWHPGQGPPMPAGMIPGAGMMPGHPTSMPPMIPGANAEGHGMEGMVPLIGYDGVTYGYIPAEEAYHQPVFGYMPQDPHARDQAELEADVQGDGDDEAIGNGAEEDMYEPGSEADEAESDQPSGEYQLESPTLTDPKNQLAEEISTVN